MRCRPGDLAVIAKTFAPDQEPYLGRIVRTVRRCECFFGEHEAYPGWLVEGDIGPFHCVDDECLRPIRDPGDDAVDEMLAIAPPHPGLLVDLEAS